MVSKKVIVYIDGFNLYFGMKEKRWQKYYWLDIHKLAIDLLKPDQELTCVKYFTSRVTDNEKKQKRQNTYLEALDTNSMIRIYYGKYQINNQPCSNCGFINKIPNEKMTDVNISTELLNDAFTDLFDVALLISADSDLASPVIKVQELFQNKSIVVCFPPNRHSKDLEISAKKHIYITRIQLSRNQLPECVQKLDGFNLMRPDRWK